MILGVAGNYAAVHIERWHRSLENLLGRGEDTGFGLHAPGERVVWQQVYF